MDTFKDFLISHIGMNITKVRSSAPTFLGTCTWHFSQCKDPVRSLIGKSKPTKAGICELLAAKWVCERFNGRSLESWLTVGGVGGKRRNLDRSKIALLAMTFGTGNELDDDAAQREHTQNWMLTQGVTAKKGRAWSADEGWTGNIGTALPDDVEQHGAPFRALITVHGETVFTGAAGHIMALDVGVRTAYFDPNYGEFDFPTFANFTNWFESYYKTSRYSWFLGNSYKVEYY